MYNHELYIVYVNIILMCTYMKSFVNRHKIDGQHAVFISVNIAPYLKAYQQYEALSAHHTPEGGLARVDAFYQYQAQRFVLEQRLSVYGAGDFSEIYALAMAIPNHKPDEGEAEVLDFYRANKPAAYEALEDSFVELLKNSVDAMIHAHVNDHALPRVLNATMRVDFDESKQDTVSVRCIDNGTGFPPDFLAQVSTLEARNEYRKSVKSHKMVEAGDREDIPLYFGGRGKGLSMLIRKIDVGTHNEPDHKFAKKNYKADVSDIVFSNQTDSSGLVTGAVIMIETSKRPVLKEEKRVRDESPQSIAGLTQLDMRFMEDNEDEEDNGFGPGSP